MNTDKINRKIIFLIIFFLICIEIFSDDNKSIIESVSVYGNVRAKESVIKRFIELKEGQSFEEENIQSSKKTLLGLGIFEYVEIEMKEGKKGIIIIISVKEKHLIYFNPLFILNSEDSDYYREESEKDLYGIEVGLNDFTGRRQAISLSTGIGSLNKIGLDYMKGYSFNFLWGISLANLWYKSYIYGSDIEIFSGKIFFKQQMRNFFVDLWTSYDNIKIDNNLFLNEPTKLFKLGADISYNSKDLEIFPTKGFVAKLGAYKVLNQNKEKLYNRYIFELSAFFNFIKRNVFALNLNTTISEGNVPLIDKIHFGGYKTLRGIPIRKYSGNNSVVLSCEYRIPFNSFIKSSNRNIFLGSSVYVFSDFGILAETMKELKLEDLRYDTGVGFIWMIMKDMALRIDFTISPKFRVTLNTGWKF